MSEIKHRQDAASDIDPIVAALADDNSAAAAVEGFVEAVEPPEAEAVDLSERAADAVSTFADEVTGIISGTEAEYASDAFDFAAVALADAVLDEAAIDEAVRTDLVAESHEAGLADGGPVDAALATEAVPAELAAGTGFVLVDNLTSGVSPSEIAPSAAEAPPFERAAAAYADTVVELENADDGPLLDSELEDGIASVFAALHAAAMDGATPPVEPLGELEAAEGITFRLLGELDRLWHRAA